MTTTPDPRETCELCKRIREIHKGFGPPHYPSQACLMGGHTTHCTCSACF